MGTNAESFWVLNNGFVLASNELLFTVQNQFLKGKK